MGCERYQGWLEEAAFSPDGLAALAPRHRAELEAHLGGCEACRRALGAKQRLVAAMDRGMELEVSAEPSPGFLARVRQRLAAEPAPGRAWFAGWMPATAAALAVLALVAVWAAREGKHEPPVAEQRVEQPAAPPAPQPGTPSEVEAPTTVRAARPPRPVRGPREPEVLVPPGQLALVRQMYDGIREGSVDLASLLADPPPLDRRPPKPREVAALEITPLEISQMRHP